jgi:hypothetical protein
VAKFEDVVAVSVDVVAKPGLDKLWLSYDMLWLNIEWSY